jgi:CRP/FNR family transcriptional regulator, cAMP and macrophage regulator
MTSLFAWREADPAAVRAAAWIARCVGRGEAAPLRREDLAVLAADLELRPMEPGQVVFAAGRPPKGVWIVRSGLVELAVGSGRRRAVVALMRPGDVDGDIQLLLRMAPPYTARAVDESDCLFLSAASFERLLAERPAIARRWLSSVAARLASSQARLLGLLGGSLAEQAARLLLDEAGNQDVVVLPQRTLAAMLGVQRPSLNKVLRQFEQQGILELSYRSVRILDPAGLKRHSRSHA